MFTLGFYVFRDLSVTPRAECVFFALLRVHLRHCRVLKKRLSRVVIQCVFCKSFLLFPAMNLIRYRSEDRSSCPLCQWSMNVAVVRS